MRRRRGSERTLNPSKAGEEGSSLVTPRSTDPLRWVHQPAGCFGQRRVPCALPLRFLPALSVGSCADFPFLSHEGEVTFAWVLCAAPGSESCSRCCGVCWGRAGEKQWLGVSSASCFPLSSSGRCIPSQRNVLRSLLPVLAAGIPSGERVAFTACSRNDLALAGPGVGAQTLSLVARHFPVPSSGSSASLPSSSAQSRPFLLFFPPFISLNRSFLQSLCAREKGKG